MLGLAAHTDRGLFDEVGEHHTPISTFVNDVQSTCGKPIRQVMDKDIYSAICASIVSVQRSFASGKPLLDAYYIGGTSTPPSISDSVASADSFVVDLRFDS